MFKTLALAAKVSTLLCSGAMAQTASPEQAASDRSRFNLGLNVSFITADLEIVSTEVDIPDTLRLEDTSLDLSDVTVEARSITTSASYFVLPFLEVTGIFGVIQSESDADLRIDGTLNTGIELIDGPISLQLNNDTLYDGFVYGAGVHTLLPVLMTPSDIIVLRSGATWAFNQFNSEELSTYSYNISSSLIYLKDIEGVGYIANLGLAYQFVDREVERKFEIGGETVVARLNQELINPWAVQLGVGVQATETITLSYGAQYNIGGELSHLLRAGWAF